MRIKLPLVQFAIITLDLALAFAVFVGGNEAYHAVLGARPPRVFEIYMLALTVAGVFVIGLAMQNAYSARALRLRQARSKTVAIAWILGVSLALWMTFLGKTSSDFSRGAFITNLIAGLPVVVLAHFVIVSGVGRMMEKHQLAISTAMIVMVGGDYQVSSIVNGLKWAGVAVRGLAIVKPQDIPDPKRAWHSDMSVVRQALDEFEQQPYDAIYLYCDWNHRAAIRKLSAHLSRIPVPLYLVADERQTEFRASPAISLGQSEAFELQGAPLTEMQQAQKRLFDIVVSSIALLIASPIMLITAIAILVESGRPVFFRQYRKGFGSKTFPILKFRSMFVQENGADVKQAQRNDPRISRVGAFIRRTSIDEFPQFLNVLRGNMSVIGPRPHALSHDDYYGNLIAEYAFRHHVKPGISGWAQVKGFRGETKEVTQMEKRVEHDLWYINHWSLRLDFYILLMTAWQTIFPKGNAY